MELSKISAMDKIKTIPDLLAQPLQPKNITKVFRSYIESDFVAFCINYRNLSPMEIADSDGHLMKLLRLMIVENQTFLKRTLEIEQSIKDFIGREYNPNAVVIFMAELQAVKKEVDKLSSDDSLNLLFDEINQNAVNEEAYVMDLIDEDTAEVVSIEMPNEFGKTKKVFCLKAFRRITGRLHEILDSYIAMSKENKLPALPKITAKFELPDTKILEATLGDFLKTTLPAIGIGALTDKKNGAGIIKPIQSTQTIRVKTLIFHYLNEAFSINKMQDVKKYATFVQNLIGGDLGKIYAVLLHPEKINEKGSSDNYNSGQTSFKRLHDDLVKVREEFNLIGASKVIEIIDKDIKGMAAEIKERKRK